MRISNNSERYSRRDSIQSIKFGAFPSVFDSITISLYPPAYLRRDDHNVMSLDWRQVAARTYPTVVRKADAVGKALADSLNEMVYRGLPQDKIHIVGHSMGAQIAGHASRRMNFTLSRITGLDPAGPLFHLLETHLSSKDASFVDTIHTDAGFYGINRATGLASFYPNGGRRIQPGCPFSYELMSPDGEYRHLLLFVSFNIEKNVSSIKSEIQLCENILALQVDSNVA
ncbi:hypothetical protein QAD02_001941 [Eretmocerus hayati]|uniref:Uncharacterized protein n=1 Tax=Eretmocerus hayati TaxID=131215 RepID=A0ACC2NHW7_9HYME|nr:hypothetical protein QAD02_001941 [Eretmocerus hayati]